MDGTEWLVDVGLGDGPGVPLPLVFGPHEHDGFTYVLAPSTFDPDGWRLEHDRRGAFVGVDFSRAPATTADFLEMHDWLSTSPASRFVKVVSISRRVEGGEVESLRGCVYSRIGRFGADRRDVTTASEWWDMVVDHFGLAYDDVPADERARLWSRIRTAHEEWDAAGRP
jgi:arylamine N-acetyltransferase